MAFLGRGLIANLIVALLFTLSNIEARPNPNPIPNPQAAPTTCCGSNNYNGLYGRLGGLYGGYDPALGLGYGGLGGVGALGGYGGVGALGGYGGVGAPLGGLNAIAPYSGLGGLGGLGPTTCCSSNYP